MDTAIRLKLGKRIQRLRNSQRLTQEKLSETSGVDYKYLQRIEGKHPPNLKLETLHRLAKALGVSVSKLLDF